MNSIILTEQQATQLAAARTPNATRILEPRRLEDGRLILNADILDDPHFSDPEKPWAQILSRAEVAMEEPKDGEPAKINDATRAAITTGLAQARSEVVSLTEAELAEG